MPFHGTALSALFTGQCYRDTYLGDVEASVTADFEKGADRFEPEHKINKVGWK